MCGKAGGEATAPGPARPGANLRKRTHVRPVPPLAAVGSRPVAHRLRIPAVLARSSRGDDRNSHTRQLRVWDARRNVVNFITYLRTFTRNEEAQDLIEYALLVGLISLVAVVAITAAGVSVNQIFVGIGARLASAA
jgi:Flp pilus assembly pilin Flp